MGKKGGNKDQKKQ
jgi:hypothetical protein